MWYCFWCRRVSTQCRPPVVIITLRHRQNISLNPRYVPYEMPLSLPPSFYTLPSSPTSLLPSFPPIQPLFFFHFFGLVLMLNSLYPLPPFFLLFILLLLSLLPSSRLPPDYVSTCSCFFFLFLYFLLFIVSSSFSFFLTLLKLLLHHSSRHHLLHSFSSCPNFNIRPSFSLSSSFLSSFSSSPFLLSPSPRLLSSQWCHRIIENTAQQENSTSFHTDFPSVFLKMF